MRQFSGHRLEIVWINLGTGCKVVAAIEFAWMTSVDVTWDGHSTTSDH
ncbi:hypothetical protein [Rhodococcus sp. NPDC049939]